MNKFSYRDKFLNKRITVIFLFAIFFSLFILNEPTRTIVSFSTFNQNYNVVYMGLAGMYLILAILNKKMKLEVLLLVFATTVLIIFSVYFSNKGISYYLIVWPGMILPLLFTGIKLDEEITKILFFRVLQFFNIVCLILVAVAILDYLSGARIQLFCAQYLFNDEISNLIRYEHGLNIYRYYSIIGHPLVNAWYFLLFYIMNTINNKYFEPRINSYFLVVATMIGLVLSGSRSAIITGVLLCIFLNGTKKYRVQYFLALIVSGIGLYFTPMFQQNLMKRFVEGASSGDASEGRNKAIEYVLNGYVKPPGLFIGGGPSYSREITYAMGSFINSFEYPFMMFVYDFSIVATILIYLLIFIIPAIALIKNKSYTITILFLAITAYMNGFNVLANYTDYLGQFCFVIMILINISDYTSKIQEKRS